MAAETESTILDVDHWREAAACADQVEVDFFAPPDDIGSLNAAKAICALCPVIDDCLGYAIESNQSEGIWGGTTPKERRRMRRVWLREVAEAS